MRKIKYLVIIISLLTIFVPHPASAESENEKLLSETFSGKTAILNELFNANNEVLINMYGFTDFDFIPALVNLEKQGVEIKMILEEAPYQSETENFDIRSMLKNYGIEVRWARSEFFLDHGKYIVIDNTEAIVLTGNGKAFCAGQDLKEVTSPELNPGFRKILEEHYNPIIQKIRNIEKYN